MNYAGFDIYAHNKATARFGRHVDARSLVPSTVAIDCPFWARRPPRTRAASHSISSVAASPYAQAAACNRTSQPSGRRR